MKEVKTLYEFKHNFYSKLYTAMEKKNKTCKDLSTDLGKKSRLHQPHYVG